MPNEDQPVWINRPPAPTDFAGIRLIRVQPGKNLEAYVTSTTMVGLNTHFAHRRTVPCTGPNCPCCLAAIPARWHGYISICSPRTKTSYVLELTALAAAPIADYLDKKGTLRGAYVQAHRTGSKPNSPVQLTISASDVDLRTLPGGVDLEKFLMTIWGQTKSPATPPSATRPPNGRPHIPEIDDPDTTARTRPDLTIHR
jgi:hypothetical protein